MERTETEESARTLGADGYEAAAADARGDDGVTDTPRRGGEGEEMSEETLSILLSQQMQGGRRLHHCLRTLLHRPQRQQPQHE